MFEEEKKPAEGLDLELELYIKTKTWVVVTVYSNDEERFEAPPMKFFFYFEQLPELVKLLIFNILDLKTLERCLIVCKEWADIGNYTARRRALVHWAISKDYAKSTWIGPTNWYRIYLRVSQMWSIKGADVVERWVKTKPELLQQMDATNFKTFYRNLFLELRAKCNIRTVDIGIAIQIWSLIMQDRCFFLDLWVAFLLQNQTVRVSTDTWNMFLDFAEEFNPKMDYTFASFDFYGAWPVLIDEFVEYVQKHKKK